MKPPPAGASVSTTSVGATEACFGSAVRESSPKTPVADGATPGSAFWRGAIG